jgi:polysaccharide pyruvyl transferase WcaK-like protein
VGLFGLLGSGNIGNDASLEAALAYLRDHHPGAVVDAMCMGPEKLTARYGLEAIPLLWYEKYAVSGFRGTVLKVLGKGIDAFRTAAWVRRHDVVIVPGMGVLETSLPLRAWGFPYAMFLLSASGRLLRTKVALVSVGATVINQRATRRLFTWAARHAYYRSFRDVQSREAMHQPSFDTSRDRVYPDLVFASPPPPPDPGDPQIVGVGVMAYYGTNDHRRQGADIHAHYVGGMKTFVRWLLDNGRSVRLVIGDASDDSVVQEILDDVRAHRPDIDPARVTREPVSSFADLTRALEPVGTVVATRYHNVLCALKLGKPTISLGYAGKNVELMADMGLSDFCQFAHSLDVTRLIEQFTELESRAAELRQSIADRNAANLARTRDQFALLSEMLFPAATVTVPAGIMPAAQPTPAAQPES